MLQARQECLKNNFLQKLFNFKLKFILYIILIELIIVNGFFVSNNEQNFLNITKFTPNSNINNKTIQISTESVLNLQLNINKTATDDTTSTINFSKSNENNNEIFSTSSPYLNVKTTKNLIILNKSIDLTTELIADETTINESVNATTVKITTDETIVNKSVNATTKITENELTNANTEITKNKIKDLNTITTRSLVETSLNDVKNYNKKDTINYLPFTTINSINENDGNFVQLLDGDWNEYQQKKFTTYEKDINKKNKLLTTSEKIDKKTEKINYITTPSLFATKKNSNII